MLDVTFKSLRIWPYKPTQERKRSNFRCGYPATLRLLNTELTHLEAHSIVFQVGITDGDLRRDGMPRVDANYIHPGVILSFQSKHGPLSYPCDTFTHWEDNLRAIGLSLEHLRTIDRYGVTKTGEQYRGWTALPAPTPPHKMTRGEAIFELCRLCRRNIVDNTLLGDQEDLKKAYREAALLHHPDRNGDRAEFNKLQEIKSILDL